MANGRIQLVTGSGSGIGEATAHLLAAAGPVLVADIRPEAGERVVADILAAGGAAAFLALDVSEPDSWTAAVTAVEQVYGRLDTLVNNAAIPEVDTIEELSIEQYRRTLAVVLDGVFFGMRAFVPLLRRSESAAIVNTCSIWGVSGGFDGRSPGYHAAKGGVLNLTKVAAVAWAEERIRVNCVHPGIIRTPLLQHADADELAKLCPMNRLGEAEEVAAAIAFLASPAASFITGAELAVDGGFLAR